MSHSFQKSGNLVDIRNREVYPATVTVENGIITSIKKDSDASYDTYLMPGFVDAHIHIESSMLIPKEFARMAVVHGTVATISDPHEIGNVMGVEGVEYMIDNGKEVPFKFHFGAPSCVPATYFESAGAVITPKDIEYLMAKEDIYYLAEMMNWPGVLARDPEVMEKIRIGLDSGKPVDGHAPGLKGEQAKQYAEVGITTDHECFTLEEALDKIKYGMKILIREGSAAKNFEALYTIIDQYPDLTMFCSDDKHPDDLMEGHINLLVRRALDKGMELFNILQAACINPVEHYSMDVGTLRKGDMADFIEVKDLFDFEVINTWIDGELVASNGESKLTYSSGKVINNFNISEITANDLKVEPKGTQLNVIEALDGELITNAIIADAKVNGDNTVSDTENDILKFVVLNRYQQEAPAIGFIKNFGLKKGAISSSVGHDCHNILAVGADDESLAEAINMLIREKGGVAAYDGNEGKMVSLPIAGIMTDKNGYDVGKEYAEVDAMAKKLGSKLKAPFMSLSFMALLVIPSLKLSDKGLFDGLKFEFKNLFV